jgi:DNA-directed RNA polymerase subunit RPC12/RpoP
MHMPLRAQLSEDKQDEERIRGIRCPRCQWRPDSSSRWCCQAADAPEPFFQGCWTEWNTFTTGGRCPGCGHQWRWTLCLACVEWSLHEDWYEERSAQ